MGGLLYLLYERGVRRKPHSEFITFSKCFIYTENLKVCYLLSKYLIIITLTLLKHTRPSQTVSILIYIKSSIFSKYESIISHSMN